MFSAPSSTHLAVAGNRKRNFEDRMNVLREKLSETRNVLDLIWAEAQSYKCYLETEAQWGDSAFSGSMHRMDDFTIMLGDFIVSMESELPCQTVDQSDTLTPSPPSDAPAQVDRATRRRNSAVNLFLDELAHRGNSGSVLPCHIAKLRDGNTPPASSDVPTQDSRVAGPRDSPANLFDLLASPGPSPATLSGYVAKRATRVKKNQDVLIEFSSNSSVDKSDSSSGRSKNVPSPQATVAVTSQTMHQPIEKTSHQPIAKTSQKMHQPIEKTSQAMHQPIEKASQTMRQPIEKASQKMHQQIAKTTQTKHQQIEAAASERVTDVEQLTVGLTNLVVKDDDPTVYVLPRQTTLETDQQYICLVTQAENPSEFYIILDYTEDNSGLRILMEEMEEYYSRHTVDVRSIISDMRYCVVRQYDDWNRCYMDMDGELDGAGGGEVEEVKVFYVDYGGEDVVPLQSIQPLVPQFCKQAPYAYLCHLVGVDPANGAKWSDTAIAMMKELSVRARLNLIVEDNSSESLGVRLLLPSGVSVAARLLEKGLAVSNTPPPTTDYKTVNSQAAPPASTTLGRPIVSDYGNNPHLPATQFLATRPAPAGYAPSSSVTLHQVLGTRPTSPCVSFASSPPRPVSAPCTFPTLSTRPVAFPVSYAPTPTWPATAAAIFTQCQPSRPVISPVVYSKSIMANPVPQPLMANPMQSHFLYRTPPMATNGSPVPWAPALYPPGAHVPLIMPTPPIRRCFRKPREPPARLLGSQTPAIAQSTDSGMGTSGSINVKPLAAGPPEELDTDDEAWSITAGPEYTDPLLAVQGYRNRDEADICKHFKGPPATSCFKKDCKKKHILIHPEGWTLDKKEVLRQPQPLMLPAEGSRLRLNVTHVDNFNHFYVQILHHYTENDASTPSPDDIYTKELLKLIRDMNTPSVISTMVPLNELPSVGEMVATWFPDKRLYRAQVLMIDDEHGRAQVRGTDAEHDRADENRVMLERLPTLFTLLASDYPDKKLYRAQILQLDVKCGRAQVRYVDFGNRCWTLLKQVYPLDQEFLLLPFQAVPCILAGAALKPGADIINSTDALRKHIQEKVIMGTVVSLMSVDTLELELEDTEGFSVAEILHAQYKELFEYKPVCKVRRRTAPEHRAVNVPA